MFKLLYTDCVYDWTSRIWNEMNRAEYGREKRTKWRYLCSIGVAHQQRTHQHRQQWGSLQEDIGYPPHLCWTVSPHIRTHSQSDFRFRRASAVDLEFFLKIILQCNISQPWTRVQTFLDPTHTASNQTYPPKVFPQRLTRQTVTQIFNWLMSAATCNNPV